MNPTQLVTRRHVLQGTAALGIMAVMPGAMAQQASTNAAAPAGKTELLKPADLASLMPPKVFYRGQSATVQIRNSGGIRYADGMLVMAALVDTSGYSTGVQQRYQAYLITEVPLLVGEQALAPGAYGIGFVAGDRFVVMDVGDHELLHAQSHHDAELRRPTPMQLLEDAQAGNYRLYAGRSYVGLRRKE